MPSPSLTPVHRLLDLARHPELPAGAACADLLLAWWHGGTFGLFNLQRLNGFAPELRHIVTNLLPLADAVSPASLGIVTDLEAIASRRAANRATRYRGFPEPARAAHEPAGRVGLR